MPNRRFFSVLALVATLGLAACSQDIPVGEPADMGGNRPDPDGGGEVLEELDGPGGMEVLEGMGVSPITGDSADRAGAPGQPGTTLPPGAVSDTAR